MAQLTKGMYRSITKSGLFGLSGGQIRCEDTVHNGGWYNLQGEKLGWGDLSKKDMANIAKNLNPGECFIVLFESDSFWNFVTKNNGPLGTLCETSPDEDSPGKEYVFSKAHVIITQNKIQLAYECVEKETDEYATWDGIVVSLIDQENTFKVLMDYLG